MGMSDCPECWETLCSCGHLWPMWLRKLKAKELDKLIEMASAEIISRRGDKMEKSSAERADAPSRVPR